MASVDPVEADLNRQQSVLVLEDSDEDFDTVREALQLTGWSVALTRARSGEECLELLGVPKRQPLRPTLALLDLNTYGLDGRQTLHEIRAETRLACLPVVVVSTSTSPRDIDYCYRAGANAYHVKPLSYPEHRALILQILQYWLGWVRLPIPGAVAP